MKGVILGLVLGVTLLAGTAMPAHASKGCGDVNKDSAVNSLDALVILQVGAGLHDPGLILFDQWDLDGDGAIASRDALIVLQYAAGLLLELPDCYG